MSYKNKFFSIAPHCSLKRLEEPCLYDIENDQLYELGEEAFRFLLACSQGESPPLKKEDEAFLQYCLSENLITLSEFPSRRDLLSLPSPVPSLRYLEFQITDRCNLACRHCYLGDGFLEDLPLGTILKVFKEFEEIQGLRLLLSGGEPLLHPHFWEMNELLREYPFRSIMLSNGTLITEDNAKKLRVHEVQLSLDGMRQGHESIRGGGTFEKVIRAIDHLQTANIRVSVATMIHHNNLREFDEMASIIQSKHIEEWNVDVPCIAGRMGENKTLWVSPQEAGPLLQYGFGGGLHGAEGQEACGAHLCAILPDGTVAKCGLFSEASVGSIDEGLRVCWERIPRIQLKELRCGCSVIEECRGGCRYRAKLQGGLFEPDLFQCYARGVLRGEPEESESRK